MFWGSIPLWAYVIYYGAKWENKDGQFGICIALTVICLYGLGCMQAHILQQKMWKQVSQLRHPSSCVVIILLLLRCVLCHCIPSYVPACTCNLDRKCALLS